LPIPFVTQKQKTTIIALKRRRISNLHGAADAHLKEDSMLLKEKYKYVRDSNKINKYRRRFIYLRVFEVKMKSKIFRQY